jgi:uncharacterized membrane protein YcaP (DUF421 family)
MVWFESWNSLGRIAGTGVVAYATLILFLRLSGKRSLSKLNAFDLVVTVALGSSLANVLLSKDTALADGVLALGLLLLLQYVVAALALRSSRFRTLVQHDPAMLLYNGNFLDAVLKAERLSQAEVLAAVRAQGVEDLGRLRAVVLETDGTITVIPAAGPPPARSSLDSVPNPGRS